MATQVSSPEAASLYDDYLSAKTIKVPIPEEEFGMYKICFHNGGACVSRLMMRTTSNFPGTF